MKDKQWIQDEKTRMNRGLGKISSLLKHSIHDLDLAVMSGHFEEAVKICYMRKSLKTSLRSTLDRRILLLKILNPNEEDD